jgi:LmbE family N-acetylglucosaminyl deacetylase
MKFLNFNKVLCLSPHPDDVEYSMLGTITKYTSTVFDVLCLTKGGAKGFDQTNGPNRLKEVQAVWDSIDTPNVNLLFSDCDFFEDKAGDAGWVNYIENNFVKNTDYDCIFLPTKDDSMFEHKFVNGLGPAIVRILPISLVEYRTPSTTNEWKPNIFVNVKDQYNKKLKSLTNFTSQTSKSYFQKNTLEAFHSNFQCRKRGIQLVEQFKTIEIFNK